MPRPRVQMFRFILRFFFKMQFVASGGSTCYILGETRWVIFQKKNCHSASYWCHI